MYGYFAMNRLVNNLYSAACVTTRLLAILSSRGNMLSYHLAENVRRRKRKVKALLLVGERTHEKQIGLS